MMLESPNRIVVIRHVRKGRRILRTGRIPDGIMCLRDPEKGRQFVQSVHEESRIEALAAAIEFADPFRQCTNGDQLRKAANSSESCTSHMPGMQKPPAETHANARRVSLKASGQLTDFQKPDVAQVDDQGSAVPVGF
jgi:hypothetical protein